MDSSIDVVFGIDMETDIGSFTDQYEGVRHGTGRLLDIMARHDVTATYFWTGHAAENNPDAVRAVCDAGHETGCHGLVHETLGDPLFPLPNNWPIFPFEVEGRLVEATRLVEEVAGVRPVSFRCPRLWGSTRVMNVLEQLGYVADASLPLYFYRSMFQPYHPSTDDWTTGGDMAIVEIPNFCDLAMESHDPYNRDRDQWPLFRTEGADALMRKVDSFIDYVTERGIRPVLCFYFHPWEFHEMPQGAIDYGEASVTPLPFITKNCGETACAEFEKLCVLLKQRDARFATCEEIADAY
ncbi:MAG: polysaccharide deacetylase family protein [Lentisphaeria bacterium]|nr:polysaccharide deacetylase family protein [Lentisphaeria bacterium]